MSRQYTISNRQEAAYGYKHTPRHWRIRDACCVSRRFLANFNCRGCASILGVDENPRVCVKRWSMHTPRAQEKNVCSCAALSRPPSFRPTDKEHTPSSGILNTRKQQMLSSTQPEVTKPPRLDGYSEVRQPNNFRHGPKKISYIAPRYPPTFQQTGLTLQDEPSISITQKATHNLQETYLLDRRTGKNRVWDSPLASPTFTPKSAQ